MCQEHLSSSPFMFLKFIYSKKATKSCKIFTLLLSYVVPVKSKVKILQHFVAFSEYMNFKRFILIYCWKVVPKLMSLWLKIYCNCMWGFQFPSRICPGLFSFYGGFFLHTVKDMSSFEVEEWMFVLDRNAIKSIARAKGQRVSLYFLQMHFFKCVKICAVGALTEYHYNFNLRSLQGRVRKVLLVWHMCKW